MDINLIGFDITLGRKKPENIINEGNACPFCDREHLSDIIATDGDMILLKNKYNVLEDADQLVLIEGRSCHSDMPDYSPDHMHRLIRFGVSHWLRLLDSGQYKSVVFFKNYGPMSGGTLRHPHMQIIGFHNIDDHLMFHPADFEGLTIHETPDVVFNISTCPRIGFGEFNIVPTSNEPLDTVADYIQIAVDNIMHHFHRRCHSYNIFFYRDHGVLRVKILPRFATSPLFIGYNIHLRPNNLEDMAASVQKIYFDKK